jgi:hypothetical protein
MGETILVIVDLSPGLFADGRLLVHALDARGLLFDAAFWLLDEENGNWHLVLSNKSVHEMGSLSYYKKIHRVLDKLTLQSDIWIGMLSVVDLRTPLVQALRGSLGAAGRVDGVRLSNTIVGGVRIPACLIYRVTTEQKLDPVPASAGNDPPVPTLPKATGRRTMAGSGSR